MYSIALLFVTVFTRCSVFCANSASWLFIPEEAGLSSSRVVVFCVWVALPSKFRFLNEVLQVLNIVKRVKCSGRATPEKSSPFGHVV